MNVLWLVGACCLLTIAAGNNWEKYVGYYEVKTTPEYAEDVLALVDLQRTTDLLFLDEPSKVGRTVTILASPKQTSTLKSTFEDLGLYSSVSDYDTTALREEWERLSRRDRMNYNYDDFNDYQTMVDELDNLASQCHPDLVCTTSTIGTTAQGRDLRMLEIKKGSNSRAIWLDSAIHAREWLSPATMMTIIKDFITGYPDAENTLMMSSYNWYYVPQMNPDGYTFTWTDDRFWRKNRRENADSSCIGVDLNRNYDSNWGWVGGADPVPCSDTYHGPSVASEPETTAVQNTVLAVPEFIEAFWSVHTHGEYFLSPLGDCTIPETGEEIDRVTNLICDAVAATHGTFWDCGNSCEVLYATSGTTSDWGFEKAGAPLSWTPELRGIVGGFAPPPSEIPFSVAEVYNGLIAMLNDINSK